MNRRDPRDVERLLEAVRFEPRPSLGPELMGRYRRGEAPPVTRRGPHRLPGFGFFLALASMLVLQVADVPSRITVVDRCCQDLDGGGPADDGLLVVTRWGTTVTRLAIYEDVDGSGNYTPGDPIRFDRGEEVVLSGPLTEGEFTREFCCLDFDGGGRHDDALVVVGTAPDRITMAAIYESQGPPGQPVRLR
jgi:hypothetical protein